MDGGNFGAPPTAEQLAAVVASLRGSFDERNAGFGGAPKFPQPMALEFLLRYVQRSGDDAARDVAVQGLELSLIHI